MKERVTLILNGAEITLTADPTMPLLWALRDIVGLRGTKFGCGAGLCGACTVLVDGEPTRSCQTQLSDTAQLSITTIEGLQGPIADAVRKAWLEHDVVQCGYCQSGQILAATALLQADPSPDNATVDDAFFGNICRCGSYQRIRVALDDASKKLMEQN